MARVINWLEILRDNRISYVERGKNVKRGELNIQCPFCGSADPSHHMGLSLETGEWACWRNSAHRGKSPLRLLTRLLNIPYYKAREIAGLGESYVDPDGFDATVARFMHRNKDVVRVEQVQRRTLAFPRTFAKISSRRTPTWRAWNYLLTRKFGYDDIDDLCRLYNLQADVSVGSAWSDRVVIPYYMDGKLVTWTARAISAATIRYKDLSIDDSEVPPKETLFNYDCLAAGGRLLVVVEGPVDALKLDFYGRDFGVRAVALSTNSMTEPQAFMLMKAQGSFEHVAVMMDNATELGVVDSVRMRGQLPLVSNLITLTVPYGHKDAGDMLPSQVASFCYQLTH